MTVDLNQIREIHVDGRQIAAVWKNGQLLWAEAPGQGVLTYVPNTGVYIPTPDNPLN